MVFIRVQPNNPHSYSPLQHKMVGLTSVPRCLEILLGEKFFDPCFAHETDKKSEKNIFCLDCCIRLCPQCLPAHPGHPLIQIRRYVYQDVLRLKDAQKLIDCSSVQAYITNSAKVVFLNQRPVTRQFRGSGNTCIVCNRNLQHPFLFCSISCKANQMESNKLEELNPVIVEHSWELENLTSDSVLELPVFTRASSESSSTSSAGVPSFTTLACPAPKRKRSSVFVCRDVCRPTRCAAAAKRTEASSRRRKRVPQRSPLY